MTPMVIDLPHNLGAAEAKRRLEQGAGSLARHFPPGANIRQHWDGNRLQLDIGLMGQEVRAGIGVQETLVRVELVLPPALAFFGKAIEAGVRRAGTELLEDKNRRS
jgi:hypothetical protein